MGSTTCRACRAHFDWWHTAASCRRCWWRRAGPAWTGTCQGWSSSQLDLGIPMIPPRWAGMSGEETINNANLYCLQLEEIRSIWSHTKSPDKRQRRRSKNFQVPKPLSRKPHTASRAMMEEVALDLFCCFRGSLPARDGARGWRWTTRTIIESCFPRTVRQASGWRKPFQDLPQLAALGRVWDKYESQSINQSPQWLLPEMELQVNG